MEVMDLPESPGKCGAEMGFYPLNTSEFPRYSIDPKPAYNRLE
jgi:hypothetical protein